VVTEGIANPSHMIFSHSLAFVSIFQRVSSQVRDFRKDGVKRTYQLDGQFQESVKGLKNSHQFRKNRWFVFHIYIRSWKNGSGLHTTSKMLAQDTLPKKK
jgi:hypothetical protein